MQEEVLKQVQETGLFKHVASFLSSSCSRQQVSGDGDTLPIIAASVCCQGAEILGGKPSSAGYCCRETCLKCLKAEDDKPITMVSGTVVNGNSEQGVDVLIPSSSEKLCCICSKSKYIRVHPASTDVLTVLLLSLPSTTWAGITDEQLLAEIHDLVSIENLPTLLQEEVVISHLFLYLFCIAWQHCILLIPLYLHSSTSTYYKQFCISGFALETSATPSQEMSRG